MKKILFLGLGHLGQFFLKQNQQHLITATKRQENKEHDFILPFSLGESWSGPQDFDTLIISFPPVENYSTKLESLLNQLGPSKQTIFISSTSVYGSGRITEESKKEGQSRNSAELIQCENLMKEREGYLIVRPGGLIDQKRHPRNFTSKLSCISQSQTQVNLVHTADVAAFLHFAIDHDITQESFNLVCDDHPSKEDFYRRLNSALRFDSKSSNERIIDNSKSKKAGFSYKYPNLDWILTNIEEFTHENK